MKDMLRRARGKPESTAERGHPPARDRVRAGTPVPTTSDGLCTCSTFTAAPRAWRLGDADGRWRYGLLLSAMLFAGVGSVGANDDGVARYADFGWRGSTAIKGDLDRAANHVREHPDDTVEILLHGSDIHLFAAGPRARSDVLHRAETLAQGGRVRFRVCDLALVYEGLTMDKLPVWVGRVDYAPARVTELRERGALSLGADDTE